MPAATGSASEAARGASRSGLAACRAPARSASFRVDLARAVVANREDLRGQQLLSRSSLLFRRADGDPNVLRESLQPSSGTPLRRYGSSIRRISRLSAWILASISVFLPRTRRFLRRGQRMIVIDERVEDRHHAVVVHLRDGIELVIVAARAGHRQSHERARGGADHVVKIVVAIVRVLLLAEQHARADAVEAGGDQASRG